MRTGPGYLIYECLEGGESYFSHGKLSRMCRRSEDQKHSLSISQELKSEQYSARQH
jgi:hypothetical protein